MVSLENPEFERFPRFREALAAAQVADLEPGDAIFIPALWWHHVVSFDVVNVLVNSLLSMRHLPPEQRQAWGRIFAYYLFGPQQDPAGHIPKDRRGVLGDISEEQAEILRMIGLQ
jgi:hypothetical protein